MVCPPKTVTHPNAKDCLRGLAVLFSCFSLFRLFVSNKYNDGDEGRLCTDAMQLPRSIRLVMTTTIMPVRCRSGVHSHDSRSDLIVVTIMKSYARAASAKRPLTNSFLSVSGLKSRKNLNEKHNYVHCVSKNDTTQPPMIISTKVARFQ